MDYGKFAKEFETFLVKGGRISLIFFTEYLEKLIDLHVYSLIIILGFMSGKWANGDFGASIKQLMLYYIS